MNRILLSQYEKELKLHTCTAYITYLNIHSSIKKQCDPPAIHTVFVGANEQIVHSTSLCNTNTLNNVVKRVKLYSPYLACTGSI